LFVSFLSIMAHKNKKKRKKKRREEKRKNIAEKKN
jgi:hypothetical protein